MRFSKHRLFISGIILFSLFLLFDAIRNNLHFFRSTLVPFQQILFVSLGFLFLITAIITFQTNLRPAISIGLLMVATFFLTLFCIHIVDFLFIWDEQYHALVAKNLVTHPFKPMLYVDPVLPYDYKNWLGNNVWLHKQPLFLWQMAISIKLFGATSWAVRIPDLIMSVILIPVIFRIGKIVSDYRTGYWAAVLFVVSDFLFMLITGASFTDHNDVAFMFYITMSLWSWVEYELRDGNRGQLKFIILTGVFAGAAILVKWLPGLLVYMGWGITILLSEKRCRELKSYAHIILAFFITLVVALPWQIYIQCRFPLESNHESRLSAAHFLNVVEGHSGNGLGWYYYIDNFREVFGISFVTWIILAFIFFFLAKRKRLTISFFIMIITVFIFFSIAATKMPSFTFMLLPLVLLVSASLFTIAELVIARVISSGKLRILLMTAIVLNIASYNYGMKKKYNEFYLKQLNTETCFVQRAKFAGLYRELRKIIPESQQYHYVIIHCPWEEIPQMMFYTGIRAAYDQVSGNEIAILKGHKELNLGYIVYSDIPVPENILNDPDILKIRFSKPIYSSDFGKCLH